MSKKILLVLVMLAALPANADFKEGLKQTGSVLVGIPTGFIVGGVRGASSKATEYVSDLSDDLDNPIAKVIAYPTGAVVGGVVGLVTGATKGLVDAFYYGINDPFSKESLSIEGEDFLDYDPYEVIHYKGDESKKVN